MPNIKSAAKRVRVSAAKRDRNRVAKSALKSSVKRFHKAVETGANNTDDVLKNTIKAIDKAAAKGIIHKNAAARRKSRLTKKLAKVN